MRWILLVCVCFSLAAKEGARMMPPPPALAALLAQEADIKNRIREEKARWSEGRVDLALLPIPAIADPRASDVKKIEEIKKVNEALDSLKRSAVARDSSGAPYDADRILYMRAGRYEIISANWDLLQAHGKIRSGTTPEPAAKPKGKITAKLADGTIIEQ